MSSIEQFGIQSINKKTEKREDHPNYTIDPPSFQNYSLSL